jgi:hypothetical protein
VCQRSAGSPPSRGCARDDPSAPGHHRRVARNAITSNASIIGRTSGPPSFAPSLCRAFPMSGTIAVPGIAREPDGDDRAGLMLRALALLGCAHPNGLAPPRKSAGLFCSRSPMLCGCPRTTDCPSPTGDFSPSFCAWQLSSSRWNYSSGGGERTRLWALCVLLGFMLCRRAVGAETMTAAKRLPAETLKPCLDPGNPAGDADLSI